MSLIAAENSTALGIFAVILLAGGYALIVVLWYLMVFRPSRRARLEREFGSVAGDRDSQPTGEHVDDSGRSAGQGKHDRAPAGRNGSA